MGFLDRMVCDAHIKDRVLEMMTARGGEEVSIIEKNSFEGSEVNDALLDAMEQVSMTYEGALDRAGDRARAALAPTRARNFITRRLLLRVSLAQAAFVPFLSRPPI